MLTPTSTVTGLVDSLYVDGVELPLADSLRLVNHSPTGFNWGYDLAAARRRRPSRYC